MACELAAALERLILRGLVLGLDVGGELVEFLDSAITSVDSRIRHRLGVRDVLFYALAIGGVCLVEGSDSGVRPQIARELRLDAVMRRYRRHCDRRRLSADLRANEGKRHSERHGKEQTEDHEGPHVRAAKSAFYAAGAGEGSAAEG